jgi:hypothetical protein
MWTHRFDVLDSDGKLRAWPIARQKRLVGVGDVAIRIIPAWQVSQTGPPHWINRINRINR